MPDFAYGVILFFTLSGFLLYRPFAAAIVRGRPLPSLRRYLTNRALRILPAYWVILLLCAFVLGNALSWDASGDVTSGRLLDPGQITRALLLLQNYFPATILVGIGPAWSLAAEVVFYGTLPLVVMVAVPLARRGASRAARRWSALAPAALVLLIGLSGKLAAAYLAPRVPPFGDWGQNWHSVVVRSFWCQADLFAFGMALAVLRVDSEDGLLRLPRWWRKGAVIGILAAYAAVWKATDGDQLSFSFGNTVIAVACALVLALVVLPADGAAESAFVRVLETRPLVAAGVVSYSIFLWHEPLIRWLDAHELTLAGRTGFFFDLLLVAGVTAVASTVTYRFVEAPALRLKFRRSGGASEPVPAAHVEAAP
jgi:peptidoglycan/LPS O-acetylase OafA/YrhL